MVKRCLVLVQFLTCIIVFSLPDFVNLQNGLYDFSGPDKESYIIDEEQSLSVHDVYQRFIHSIDITKEERTKNLGFTDSAVWFMFGVQGVEDFFLELNYPLMDEIQVYSISNGRPHLLYVTGYNHPYGSRPVDFAGFIFPLTNTNKAKGQHYILRVANSDRLEMPLVIRTQKNMFQYMRQEQLVQGIYFGILLVMLLYNIFLFFSVKEKLYLIYSGFILSFMFYQLTQTGHLYEFLGPLFLDGNNHYIPFSVTLAYGSVIAFGVNFLGTKKQTPVLHRILMIILYSSLTMFVLNFILPYHVAIIMNIALMFIALVFIYVAAWIIARKGFSSANYYIVGWTTLIIGACIYGLKSLGWLPSNFFTRYIIQIGSALEVILVSLAMGDRINIMKNQLIHDNNRHLLELRTILESFERFVPKQFLHLLDQKSLVDVKLGDHVPADMTILFADLRSFTSISEKMTGQEVFDFLNNFFSRLTPCIERAGGFIDKYIGDAIMALFPGKIDDALEAAVGMVQEIELFNANREKEGKESVAMGIGIHSGECILGTIGNHSRMDGTVISDTVNTASRLEGLNKNIKAPVIVSQIIKDTMDELSPNAWTFRCLGLTKIKGKAGNERVYELLDAYPEKKAVRLMKNVSIFEQAVAYMERGNTMEALRVFKNHLVTNPEDIVARALGNYCIKQKETKVQV